MVICRTMIMQVPAHQVNVSSVQGITKQLGLFVNCFDVMHSVHNCSPLFILLYHSYALVLILLSHYVGGIVVDKKRCSMDPANAANLIFLRENTK